MTRSRLPGPGDRFLKTQQTGRQLSEFRDRTGKAMQGAAKLVHQSHINRFDVMIR